jgi:hypothetical protein
VYSVVRPSKIEPLGKARAIAHTHEYQIAVLWEKSEILVGSLPQSEENDESEG